jgi:hypothetical protein
MARAYSESMDFRHKQLAPQNASERCEQTLLDFHSDGNAKEL